MTFCSSQIAVNEIDNGKIVVAVVAVAVAVVVVAVAVAVAVDIEIDNGKTMATNREQGRKHVTTVYSSFAWQLRWWSSYPDLTAFAQLVHE